MSIVSISEAARLTGKSRKTIHRHIDTGRISKSHTNSGEQGIEISELIRVYGKLKTQSVTSGQMRQGLCATGDGAERPSGAHHDIRQNDTELRRIHDLEKEVKSLNRLLSSKQETIDSLKTALKLLEYRQDKSITNMVEPSKEDNASDPQKNGSFVNNTVTTGLLGRSKKFFG